MSAPAVHRDERTLSVENTSYRWAFQVFAYGLLAIVAYRAYAGEAAWDLLALIVLGGAVASGYQWMHDVLTKQSVWIAVVGMVLAAAVAAVMVWLR